MYVDGTYGNKKKQYETQLSSHFVVKTFKCHVLQIIECNLLCGTILLLMFYLVALATLKELLVLPYLLLDLLYPLLSSMLPYSCICFKTAESFLFLYDFQRPFS